MTTLPNPFVPGFGQMPPQLAGRDDLLRVFRHAFTQGPSHRFASGLLLGQRGVGKTVLLAALRKEAKRLGWLTITEVAHTNTRGDTLIERLSDEFRARTHDRTARARVAGVKALGIDVDLNSTSPDPQLPSLLNDIRNWASQHETVGATTGVLVTVDEVHAMEVSVSRDLGFAFQTARQNRLPFALVAAGLPEAHQTILNDPGSTYLQRLEQWDIEPLSTADADAAMSFVLESYGMSVDGEAIRSAARESRGSPYMVQLIGWSIWERAMSDIANPKHIDQSIVQPAIREAATAFKRSIALPIWRDLSGMERQLLQVMVDQPTPVSIRNIRTAIERDAGFVSVYRSRLLQKGAIVAAGHGYVDFAHPTLRDVAADAVNGLI